jgi:hypothetical protein
MQSASQHRREGAFDMSTDEQTDSMAAGSDVSPDDSKLSLTVDKTRLEHHAEHRDLAMQEGPLGLEGDALGPDKWTRYQGALAYDPNGQNPRRSVSSPSIVSSITDLRLRVSSRRLSFTRPHYNYSASGPQLYHEGCRKCIDAEPQDDFERIGSSANHEPCCE